MQTEAVRQQEYLKFCKPINNVLGSQGNKVNIQWYKACWKKYWITYHQLFNVVSVQHEACLKMNCSFLALISLILEQKGRCLYSVFSQTNASDKFCDKIIGKTYVFWCISNYYWIIYLFSVSTTFKNVFWPKVYRCLQEIYNLLSRYHCYLPTTTILQKINPWNKTFWRILNIFILPYPTLPRRLSDKESACQCRRHRRHGYGPWVGKIPLEEKMAPHSSLLAWKIPWTEEPGGLQSMGSQSWTWLRKVKQSI